MIVEEYAKYVEEYVEYVTEGWILRNDIIENRGMIVSWKGDNVAETISELV